MSPKRRSSGRSERTPAQFSLVASLMLIGLLIVGGVFVVLSGEGDDEATQTPTPQPTTVLPTQEPTEPTTDDETCAVTDKSQKLPESAPNDISWTLWKGMALPASKSAGPLEVDDQTGVTGCYARTPMGAVMATMNIGFRAWLAAPDTSVVDKQFADGTYKQEYRDLVAQEHSASADAQIAGFQIVSYEKSNAIIAVAVGDSRTGYAKGQMTLTWTEGTWKAVATAQDVSEGGGWQGINSLDGFIELRGVD